MKDKMPWPHDHKVITAREVNYPFRPYWMCVCGHPFEAAYMGIGLFREFAQHQEENT